MLDEGKITQREYEVVKTEILEAPAEEWATPSQVLEVEALPVDGESWPVETLNGGHQATATAVLEAVEEEPESALPEWLAFAKEIPPLYWASVGAAVLTVFFAGLFSPIAWVTSGVSIAALVKVKQQSMRWMAWAGLAVGVLFSMIGIFTSGSPGSVEAQPLPAASSGPADPDEIPVGSLGIEFADLQEGWNALPDPPFILKGISVTPEAGVLDSFMYRFDDAALLAGAYNPDDGYVYALMAKIGIGHEAMSNMYVHLCYLLYPGTQECFDSFIEESGVYGKTPDELSEADSQSSWIFDGNEWRVEVVNDIQTIRVLGPQQTG
jgi:hypothetical protein